MSQLSQNEMNWIMIFQEEQILAYLLMFDNKVVVIDGQEV